MSRAALRLGANDARTQATAGTALFYMAHDFATARLAIARAIEINPNEYTAQVCGGWIHAMKGEAEAAHAMFDLAEKLNPLSYGANGLLSGRAMAEFMAEFMAGRINEAERYVKIALATDDSHPSTLMTGLATAALLGAQEDVKLRRAAFLEIYPAGLVSPSIKALPFEDPRCRQRYFDAVKAGGLD
jgi:tetratricopeptide (TPR) repeat protein